MACSRESQEKDTKLESEIKEEFLSCKICYEPFTSPKSLSCLHTFCEKCLEAHLATIRTYKYSDHREFPCPMCRKRTTLPSGGVRALPDNFLVSSLNELVSRQRVTKLPFCEVCKLVNKKVQEAKAKCIECNKLMCKPCVDKHTKTKITATHNMFDIDIEKDIGCKVHPEEMVKYFCENCETCICVLCTFQEHADHDLLSFQEGVTKYRGDMYRLLNKCKSMISGYTKIADVLQKTDDIIKTTEKEIKDTSHAFVAAIRSKEKQMIDELHNVYGQDVLDFIAKRADIDVTLNNLASTTRLADVIMKGSPMEMLLLKKDVQDKLEDLSGLCPPELPDKINKKVMFIQGSVLLGSLESGHSIKSLGISAFTEKRPRNREVQTDPMWIHDLTDEDGEPVARSIKVNYVERYQEETQTEPVETRNMWCQTKENVEYDDVWSQTGEDEYGFFEDEALWYYNEKAWYQKDLEDETVQTDPIDIVKEIINGTDYDQDLKKNILNAKLKSDMPKMVDAGTQLDQTPKPRTEVKAVQTTEEQNNAKNLAKKHQKIQTQIIGDPLGMKPKEFRDQFAQSERIECKDSGAQLEVGDPLWVSPKEFRDAWVQIEVEPLYNRDTVGKVAPSHEDVLMAAKSEPVEGKTAPKTSSTMEVPNAKSVVEKKNATTKSDSGTETKNAPKIAPAVKAKTDKFPNKSDKKLSTSQKELTDTDALEMKGRKTNEEKQPLSEFDAFRKAREEMHKAAKAKLDSAVSLEHARTLSTSTSDDSDEEVIESNVASPVPEASQARPYGPISIPPGTIIRKVQNLPVGAVPIDPSRLPPGIIPMHVTTNPMAFQPKSKTDSTAQAQRGPRTVSEDSGDELFVQRIRPNYDSSESETDDDTDSDELQQSSQKNIHISVLQPVSSLQAQPQRVKKISANTLKSKPRVAEKSLKWNGRKLPASSNSNKTKPIEQFSEKTKSNQKREDPEPIKRAMSSDLIPLEDSRLQQKQQTDGQSNARAFSIMDDGWGV